MKPRNTPIAKFAETEARVLWLKLPSGFRYALSLVAVMLSLVGVVQAQTDPVTITPQGKVGVGTTSPANKLSVAGDTDVSGKVGIGTTTPANKLSVAGDIDVSGKVGIGTATPQGPIDVRDSSGRQIIWNMAQAGHTFVSANGGNAHLTGNLYFNGSSWNRINTANAGGIWWAGNDGTLGVLQTGPGSNPVVNLGYSFFINTAGNVGIGTSSPARALDVRSSDSGAGMVRLRNTRTSAGEASIGFFGSNGVSDADAWVAGVGAWANTGNFTIGYQGVKLSIDQRGNVGIGTTSPGKGKLEISGTSNDNKPGFSYKKWLNINGLNTGGSPNESLSMYASDAIAASAVFAFSDERMKKIHGRSDGAKDLETLMRIEITDYEYGDTIERGRTSQKKVIGQQVERVFPEAVRRSTDVVPDIYQKATIKDGWVILGTNLKKGERVRLIGEDKEAVWEVVEVAGGKFRTAFAPVGDRVFVYGREVNDFRNVDYDAISMLNVSATQYLKKETDTEVKALQDENAALRTRLAAQEQRVSDLETKVDALLAHDKQAACANTSKKVD